MAGTTNILFFQRENWYDLAIHLPTKEIKETGKQYRLSKSDKEFMVEILEDISKNPSEDWLRDQFEKYTMKFFANFSKNELKKNQLKYFDNFQAKYEKFLSYDGVQEKLDKYIEKQPTIIPNTKPSKPQKPQRPSKDSIGDNPFVASDSHKKLTTVTSERILPRRTAPQASRSVTQNTIISPPKDNEEPLNSKPPVSGLPQRNIQDKNPSDDASTSVKKEINPQNTPQNGSKTQQGNRPLPRPLPDQPTKAKDVQQLENTQKRKSITESPVTLRPTANNRGNNSNARGSASTRAKRHSVATSSSIQSRPLPTPNSTSNCPNSTGSRPLPKPPGNT
mmetsp:Transcript_33736/g.57650  ORF Transcript_33736/g.57650 Transcript_33736/m.57650 type:complete len:335 (+) Transcript_33736:232-1236(+)